MKSLRKKLKVHGRLSQSTPLINGPSSPDYQTEVAVTRGRVYQSVSSVPEDVIENDFIHEEESYQRQRLPSTPTSPASPTFETSFSGMQKKEASWVTEARVQSTKEPVLCAKDTTFYFVEIATDDPWFDGIWQTAVILLLFFILPSVIFAIAGGIFIRCIYIPNAGRSKREQKKVRVLMIAFLASLVVSIVKDSIIAMAVVRALFNLETTTYDIVFAAILLFLLITLFVAPIMVYAFSGARFSYASEASDSSDRKPDKKGGMKLAVEFMKTHLSSLHEVTCLKEQGIFLFNCFPRCLFLVLSILFLLLCASRSLTPLFLTSLKPRNVSVANTTANTTKQNITLTNMTPPSYLRDLVIVFSAINSFVVTFALAAAFMIITSWNIVMLKLWKRFFATLKNSDDLFSIGMEGIVAWWRVYQTMLFLSLSSKTPLGFLHATLNCLFSGLITAISIFLLKCVSPNGFLHAALWFVAIDILMLILGLIASLMPCFLVNRIQKSILQELSLKRLNMAAQAGLTNPDAEKNEGEYHVHLKRFKGRNLRTSQQLLQELFSVLKESDSQSLFSLSTVTYLAVVVFGFASLVITVKGLTY